MKRAVIFAHFDKDDIIDDYVVYYIRCLRDICIRLIFISTARLPESEVSKVEGICDKVIVRENIGYDFMSYKTGLEQLKTGDYDEVVLCNDSVYGPFFPLSEMFGKMERVECDFWGVTESCEIARHLQSYFLVFREKALKANCFQEFWDNLFIRANKQEIIDEYEVGLSQMLFNSGATGKAYCRYRPSSIETIWMYLKKALKKALKTISTPEKFLHPMKIANKIQQLISGLLGMTAKCGPTFNPAHFFWRQLIEISHMPFIKVELLRDNPMGMIITDYDDFIKSISDYNTDYIKRHLERVKKVH